MQDVVDRESNFALEKKEREADRLEAENKIRQLAAQRRNLVNGLIALGIAALALTAFFAWYLFRQRKTRKAEGQYESDTARQLAATEALLKEEEQEKARLARHLHEGLGTLQTGIRQTLRSTREARQQGGTGMPELERDLGKMDNTVQSLHEDLDRFMPEALARFGLDAALRAYCGEVSQSGALNIAFQSQGLETGGISPATASGIYRIVVELIDNINRHADARHVIVRVSQADGKLQLMVHDDGKGFDPAALAEQKGGGWSGILDRVDVLKGSVDVQSEAGHGTTVQAEFFI
jgi:signal transduction histidine kinase